ncbi:hypothetical protein [Roseivivax isoporae]|uniref:Uncharacterized protein n=1 Tax=Roseivivax isoporae LMG 25204 TaxID=1449351 RepID=X7F4K5_9RHOB|nr:hypothetical protein [Roseivivax isoporae]ETX27658.1 hypothetical protein RISW2_11985 [Roseivivax isoporae LMG 25204]
MRALALAALTALSACGGAPEHERPAEAPAARSPGEIETTGYAEMGISNEGLVGGGGFAMRRGNFTLGFEL